MTRLCLLFCLVAATATAAIGQFKRSVSTAENFEPAIARPAQIRAAKAELSKFKRKIGKKPNILWIIVDEMGYGDPGCNSLISPLLPGVEIAKNPWADEKSLAANEHRTLIASNPNKESLNVR